MDNKLQYWIELNCVKLFYKICDIFCKKDKINKKSLHKHNEYKIKFIEHFETLWSSKLSNFIWNHFNLTFKELNRDLKMIMSISWLFQLEFGNLASSASFLSCVIKLLINATLHLPHPASQAPFLSRIMLHLICL